MGVKGLTPMSDQDRISPHKIYTISSRQVMRIKKISIRGFQELYNSKGLAIVYRLVKRGGGGRLVDFLWEGFHMIFQQSIERGL